MCTWLTLNMWLSPGGMTLGEGPVAGQGQTVSICPGSCWALIFYARFEHWGQQGLCHLLASREGVEVNVRPEAIDLYPGDPALTSVLEQRWSHRGYVCFCFSSFSLFYLFFKKSVYPPPSRFPGGSEVKNPPANAGDMALIPASGRSPGEENGNPDQYSCLENPMDRGAWQAAVHGVAKSWTLLSDWAHTLPPPECELQEGRECLFIAVSPARVS